MACQTDSRSTLIPRLRSPPNSSPRSPSPCAISVPSGRGSANIFPTKPKARWPLRRQSGRLRRSLIWTDQRLGHGGIFKSTPDRLVFGTRVFYAAFHQRGAKHLPVRQLVHVDPDDIGARLNDWAVARARVAGFFF